MVASTGAKYDLRPLENAYYHETPEILRHPLELALANGLTRSSASVRFWKREKPVSTSRCRRSNRWFLFDLSAEDFGKIVLAYEPVWTIGYGKTASAEQAERSMLTSALLWPLNMAMRF